MLRPHISPSVPLATLAQTLELGGEDDLTTEISGVTLIASDVEPGDLFVALPGVNRHGAEFVEQAASRGAAAVLTDTTGAASARATGLPVLVVDQPRSRLGAIASTVYGTAERSPVLLGVTGTNGKTSTVHMLEGILRQLGVIPGLSSTAERHIGDTSVTSGLTTPEATELHALVARMEEEGVGAAAIEVSAQALTRRRVDGVVFDVAGFTNLSHDHLDDYGDMDTYFGEKARLFRPDRARRAVVSLDSPAGARLCEIAGVPVTTITSVPGVDADWIVSMLEQEFGRTRFRLQNREGRAITTSVPIIGVHMAANAGLALVMLIEAGWPIGEIRAALHRDGGVDASLPGRTERVSGERGPTVYVDFGHSADAFARTLEAVREVTPGRVIMVFGADGDRDALKRPAMAEVAVRGSDALVITDHHPRFEDPASIRRTLVDAARAARPDAELHEVDDPKRAIRVAVSLAHEGDAILWAGPGHQNYRDILGVRTPYSARAEARAALREAGWADEAVPATA
ncbi:UDP-N-acetylmuramoyl-L-alanyl-D-glutamate--2,6-diaminopimelate ligase [Rathayibacter rathayi]|uniref:UDP-N-acetylmuramyl-tripeptide synthetase n=1 Tax=Rathayibacter rathayi TaxID=33887 RepID=A0ABD6W8Z4_RATRA|nr:UDP-N-acetylmuramoyl-L-alanyl-D-glutamate--2,6-diaminopimelate ligase [Rathayibacter rathayi]PPF14250.1 UDP-N-acetylmuramoyl-L-alanyl-D-glutamate--2,6-diaminopimelate ligase [Rathayibacter rathayi]PPF25949.1 UDP-N-acetylmuramoyl-L-alanyl-D-glutamate--2,6-diaminopimelate ligase [Rathayibacter rathayi]PPF81141.1 UDP-N-acetylmuramoyl-L-alanyl-D-glutamate--2,6-diaminopimelate ligase [Rathayibacter rathayi]PPG12215.1 UDP-N-acetylmuramoyl-L-alanyl-D-glutamate--2,6-diaminopimelate ligase [Rathayiba